MVYVTVKISAHSVQDSTYKNLILIDYSKFHVTHNVILLCLQAQVNTSNIVIKLLLMHKTVVIVLA